jgi:hypothetical protein
MSEPYFPRPPIDSGVGIGIGIVGLVDNPDTSHGSFPLTRQSESRLPDRPRAFNITRNPVAEFCQLRRRLRRLCRNPRLAESKSFRYFVGSSARLLAGNRRIFAQLAVFSGRLGLRFPRLSKGGMRRAACRYFDGLRSKAGWPRQRAANLLLVHPQSVGRTGRRAAAFAQ